VIPSWLRVVIIGGALVVAAIVGVLSTGSADVWPVLWLVLIAVGGLVATAAAALLAKKVGSSAARHIGGRRPTWRSVFTAGGALLVAAMVGLLAFNTYAILSEEGSGRPSFGESEPAPSAPLSPAAQETPACPAQQVYMPGLRRCVPAALSCAPTERYDRLRQRCVPDIPEPVEPIQPDYREPLPAPVDYGAQHCQEAQADLADATAEFATSQADLAECESARHVPVPEGSYSLGSRCSVEESRVQFAALDVESAAGSVRIWCR